MILYPISEKSTDGPCDCWRSEQLFLLTFLSLCLDHQSKGYICGAERELVVVVVVVATLEFVTKMDES